MNEVALEAKGLVKTYKRVRAVQDVSLVLRRGRVTALVGESGSGKSTVAKLLARLVEPTEGEILLDGRKVRRVREYRRKVQMVFQDPFASLNPVHTIRYHLTRPLKIHKRTETVEELLQRVNLPADFASRYPHELSGGQRQRVNIARALALEPQLVILDEAVSALDKSIEAQVLNLLMDLKARFDLTYVFISHDLNVVRYVSDRVMVMYLGKVVEIGPVDRLYADPKHPYTQALLSAMPSMDPRRRTERAPLTGDPPNPINPPSGCRFRTRCPFAEGICAEIVPSLAAGSAPAPVGEGRAAACHMVIPNSGHSRAPGAV